MSSVNRMNPRKAWLALVLAPALLAAGALAALPAKSPKAQQKDQAAATSYANRLSQAFRDAARQVQPSVVMIKTEAVVPVQWKGHRGFGGDRSGQQWFGQIPFGNIPELKRFFDEMPNMPEVPNMPELPEHGQSAVGSGVIIDPSGVVLTNNHVVEGRKPSEITVRLSDGREFRAAEVKTDPNTDLAVVRIEGAGHLVAARLGDSDKVEVGDWVLALGHPFGLENTVTSGIISAKGRGIGMPARATFLQTDAAINPGNSGGPLVNLDGEVIGINTAISTRSGGNQGVGFAIPVNLAKWVSGQLIKNGTVHRAQLGVMVQTLTPELAEQFGVKAGLGVLVADVMAKTPAAKAGLKQGDVIVEYEGRAVSTPRELQAAVEQSKIGAKHELVVVRDGKRQTVEAVPREASGDVEEAAEGLQQAPGEHRPSQFKKLGIEVENLTPELAEQLGGPASGYPADHGVAITDVLSGSPADRAGLEAGMVILQANRKPVDSVEKLRSTLDKANGGVVLLLVCGEQGSRFVIVHSEG